MLTLRPSTEGRVKYWWIDPGGVRHLWDATTGFDPQWGQSDFRAPPVTVKSSPLPRRGGAVVTHVRREPRQCIQPMLIRGRSESELWDMIRLLAEITDPIRGPGTLQIQRPDGTIVQNSMYYSGGLDLTEKLSPDTRGIGWAIAPVSFYVPDPLWKDADEVSYTLEGFGTTVPFLSTTFLPLRLTSGRVVYSDTIVNSGGAEAWPVWTIYGPGTNPSIVNLSTNERFTVGVSLDSGEYVVVDASGDNPVVIDQGGHILTGTLPGGSTVFSLRPGVNVIQVEVSDNTSESRAELRFRRAWLTI